MATEVISREAQREFPRFTISSSKPVRVDLGPAGSGQVLDISLGGIRVKSVAPLRRDTEIPVCLYIPETSGSLRCTGQVMWSKPTGAAGLKFKNLDDSQKAVLTAWIEEIKNAASGEKPAGPDEFVRITAQIKAMKLNNADALSTIVRRATQLTNASGIVIALGKPENMVCLGRGGNAPEVGSVISPNAGLTGECVRGRKTAICDDASVDPRGADLGQGSAVILPLLVNGELRGVMQVFSAQPRAFDAKSLENLEKLADAVVFVAHNVTPQRRLASVTPMPTPVSAPIVAAPPMRSSRQTHDSKVTPITRAGTAPAVSKPSDSGRIGSFTGPVVKLPVISPPKPAPIAKPDGSLETSEIHPSEAELPVVEAISLEPLAGSVESTPVATPSRFESAQRPLRPVAVPSTTYHVHTPKRPPWMIAVPVIAVLAVGAGVFYWSQHRGHATTAPVAAAVAPAPAVAAAPAPAENVAVTASSAVGSTATTIPESAPLTKASATTAAQPVKTRNAEPMEVIEATEKKTAPAEIAKPEPAAMIISSGAPVQRPAKVEDIAAPSATGIVGGASLPGIAMPTAVAKPKLINARSSTLTGGTLLERVPPAYPQAAKANRIEGKVELAVVVSKTGTVQSIRKVSGNQYLAQATIEAVKRWRYEPFKLDGDAVEREITIEVNFKAPN